MHRLCFHLLSLLTASLLTGPVPAQQATAAPSVTDSFKGKMGDGWKWLRENKAGWRLTNEGLQVLVEPGNMWGPANDARNVLLHPVPEALRKNAEAVVQVSHKPENRWEQADFVWYCSDSAMVKIGLEIENGRTNIVMGREEGDKTKTIAIIPYDGNTVQLRFVVKGENLTGYFRKPGAAEWTEAGKATTPAEAGKDPQISLQFYQGVAGSNRWATVQDFRLAAPAP